MSNQEFFELYKWCEGFDGNIKGILCGYNSQSLIMQAKTGWPAHSLREEDYVENMNPGNQYWYIDKSDVNTGSKKIEILSDSTKAEQYIKKYFSNITDEESDIYINIFMAGVNSIKS